MVSTSLSYPKVIEACPSYEGERCFDGTLVGASSILANVIFRQHSPSNFIRGVWELPWQEFLFVELGRFGF